MSFITHGYAEVEANLGTNDLAGKPVPEEQRPGIIKKTTAAFKLENTLASYMAARNDMTDNLTLEEQTSFVNGDFNPVEYARGTELDKPEHLVRVAEARSPREVQQLQRRITREAADRKTMESAGTMEALGLYAVAGMLSPEMIPAALIPGVFTAAGARAVYLGTVSAGISEALLQSTQVKRTLQESAYNVLGSAILGGAIGHIGGKLDTNIRAQAKAEIESILPGGALKKIRGLEPKQFAELYKRQNEDFAEFYKRQTTPGPGGVAQPKEDFLDFYIRNTSEDLRTPEDFIEYRKVIDDEIAAEAKTKPKVEEPEAKEPITQEEMDFRAEELDVEGKTFKDSVIGIDDDGMPIYATDPIRPGYGTGIGAEFIDEIAQNVLEPKVIRDLAARVESKELSIGEAGRIQYKQILKATELKRSWLVQIFKYFHPGLRLAMSDIPEMRFAAMQLSDDAYIREMASKGLTVDAPVTSLIHDSAITRGIVPITDAVEGGYSKYLGREHKLQSQNPVGFVADAISDRRNKAAGRLTREEFNDEVHDAITTGKSDIPEAKEAADKIAEIVKRVKEDEVASGMVKAPKDGELVPNVGDENLMPRVFDMDKVQTHSTDFEFSVGNAYLKQLETKHADALADILDHIDYDVLQSMLMKLAAKYRGNIVRNPADAAFTKGIKFPKSWNVPPELEGIVFNTETKTLKADGFITTDLKTSMHQWLRTAVPKIELTRQFGDHQLTDVISDLEKAAEEHVRSMSVRKFKDDYIVGSLLEEVDIPKKQLKFEKKLRDNLARERKDLEAMAKFMTHDYARVDDPTLFFNKGVEFLKKGNVMTKLGGMTISSISDIGTAMMQVGMLPFGKSIAKFALAGSSTMAREQALKWGVGIDLLLNTRMNQLADLGGTEAFLAPGMMDKAVSGFSKLTLMAQWNAGMKQLAALTAADNLTKMAGKKVLSEADLTHLARIGINPEDWSLISKELLTNRKKEGAWDIPNTEKWENEYARDTFHQAMVREADVAVVTPGPGDVPLAARGQLGGLLFQFKTFLFTTNNRVVIPGMQEQSANTIASVTAMIGLGALSFALKEVAAGRGDELKSHNADKWIKEGIERSGALGIIWSADSIADDFSAQKYSAQSALLGDAPVTRRMANSSVNDLIGPWYGTLTDAARATTAAVSAVSGGDVSPGDVGAARRLIPYQNLFYLRNGFDKLEELSGGREYK